MKPSAATKDTKPSATEQEIEQTLKNFSENFIAEGFLVFTKPHSIDFAGQILVNYKGLGIIKFTKSQLHQNEFDPAEYSKMCKEKINNREQLFQELRTRYPHSSFCVI